MIQSPSLLAIRPIRWTLGKRFGNMSGMPSAPAPLPNDPLGRTLHLLRLCGTLYCRAELTAPWAVDMPALPGMLMFHVVTAGRGWIEVPGATPRPLLPGSLTLVPHGTGHRITSDPQLPAAALFDIPVERVSEHYEVMRHGGGGEPTQALCGVVRFDHLAGQRLIDSLPALVQIDSWSEDDASWLQSTLRFIAREAGALRPGGETVITRLADILVIQALRAWLDSAPEATTGWLAALRDRQVGQALARMHAQPEAAWSLESLAREVGMSRSAFAARFTALVGEPALQYLTQWRLQLARAWLQEGPQPLAQLAGRVGYQSEAAFCRAFKRHFGVPPGSARRDAPEGLARPAGQRT
jgi:AraC-like DNA-binding protein